MSSNPLTPEQKQILLETARASIRHGLEHGRALQPELDRVDDALREPRATFVTLEIGGQLRGCIGSLVAHRPLLADIAANAHAAAFSDPRFPPLRPEEYDHLDIHLSLLSRPEPMRFDSEEDLLRQLRPGVDGLILSDKGRRGTFLPSVWAQLPTPEQFLRHLKLKAGLPANYWSGTIRVDRYTVDSIG